MSGNREKPEIPHENWDIRTYHIFGAERINSGPEELAYKRGVMTVNGLTIEHSLWVFYVMLKQETKVRGLELPELDKTTRQLLDEISREPPR